MYSCTCTSVGFVGFGAIHVDRMFECCMCRYRFKVTMLYAARYNTCTCAGNKLCSFSCIYCFTVFSFCVVLLVSGLAEYNDSLTAAFRRIPAEEPSLVDKFAYIDSTRQTEFLTPLPPITGVACSSGGTARPVSEWIITFWVITHICSCVLAILSYLTFRGISN